MKMEPILEDLEAAAAKLGVKVSYEVLMDTVAGGGLCKVKGAYRVIIEKRGTAGEKAVTLAKALAALDVEGIFLTPAARELVERHRTLRGA
jgi:hypothetical protein